MADKEHQTPKAAASNGAPTEGSSNMVAIASEETTERVRALPSSQERGFVDDFLALTAVNISDYVERVERADPGEHLSLEQFGGMLVLVESMEWTSQHLAEEACKLKELASSRYLDRRPGSHAGAAGVETLEQHYRRLADGLAREAQEAADRAAQHDEDWGPRAV